MSIHSTILLQKRARIFTNIHQNMLLKSFPPWPLGNREKPPTRHLWLPSSRVIDVPLSWQRRWDPVEYADLWWESLFWNSPKTMGKGDLQDGGGCCCCCCCCRRSPLDGPSRIFWILFSPVTFVMVGYRAPKGSISDKMVLLLQHHEFDSAFW